jgi:adenylate cyclase
MAVIIVRQHPGSRDASGGTLFDVGELTRTEAADRAGVGVDEVNRLIEAGVISPDPEDRLSTGDVRRVRIIQSLEESGLPLDEIATGLRQGTVSLDFADSRSYERFAAVASETFEEASARTGVPLPLLLVIRDAIGSAPARPVDRLRDDELAIVPFVQRQVELGFRPIAIERLLRAMGDNLRRIAEAEAEWWLSEVITPRLEAGKDPSDFRETDSTEALGALQEPALLAFYHASEAQTWTANIVSGFDYQLTKAGLHRQLDRPPAICFLDITGYTRLTQEHGDQAASELAEKLARIVQRTSVQHGGRPVKWLGDGVMFLFKDPGPGVVAALEMVDGVAGAGLPPAHVGLDAGPILSREGDYYGLTVNVAARIAEYARPGEVLVSQAVVDAANLPPGAFSPIGPVELKGVSGAIQLHAARRQV